jgi:two-component system KDP operon response regulator KdpE
LIATDRPLILIVEDEKAIRRFLRVSLGQQEYRLLEAESGRQAMVMIKSRPPDLIILDLGLPDMDGVEIIDYVRSWSQMPIIVLSARNRDLDKVEALDRGADDYLTKPFSVSELEARLRVAFRHRIHAASPDGDAIFEAGDLRAELGTRRVTVRGKEIHLTPIEYRLLTKLIEHADRVLTHRFLEQEVWGPSRMGGAHHLRVHMANLRRKIESDPARPRLLLTEQGVGYRLSTEDMPEAKRESTGQTDART